MATIEMEGQVVRFGEASESAGWYPVSLELSLKPKLYSLFSATIHQGNPGHKIIYSQVA
jgi:hypothetical protein